MIQVRFKGGKIHKLSRIICRVTFLLDMPNGPRSLIHFVYTDGMGFKGTYLLSKLIAIKHSEKAPIGL